MESVGGAVGVVATVFNLDIECSCLRSMFNITNHACHGLIDSLFKQKCQIDKVL